MKPFYDLSIINSDTTKPLFKQIFSTLYELGYKTVAINTIMEEKASSNKNKKRKKGDIRESVDFVPEPIDIEDLKKEFCGKLEILQRLTFHFSDQHQLPLFNQSKNIKKYNLLAVIPTKTDCFQTVCSSLEVDIITFNYEHRSPIQLNRKMYNMATERGIFFELMYAPAIRDSTARKNIIRMGHLYHSYGKSKNIIISSGALNEKQLRGPYDVINLGILLGLSEEKAKCSITNESRTLLLRAESRRCGKILIYIENEDSNETFVEEEMEDEPATKMVCV